MTDTAQIHALMAEIGPRLELAEVTASEEHGEWTLVVDEATVLFADWDEERQCVWLSAEVGTPAASDRLRLYELLLVYNNRWAETGGVRMALDDAGGSVVMTYDLPAAGLDVVQLDVVLTNLIDKLRAWREVVARQPGHDAPATAADESGLSPDPALMAGFIRV